MSKNASTSRTIDRPEPGYLFAANDLGKGFLAIPNDSWDIEVFGADELYGALPAGERRIDGVRCRVWSLADGRYAAAVKRG